MAIPKIELEDFSELTSYVGFYFKTRCILEVKFLSTYISYYLKNNTLFHSAERNAENSKHNPRIFH